MSAPRVNNFHFGRIVIDGREYRRDLIIFPDGVLESWPREEGHRLGLVDLKAVLEKAPKTLVIGTGALGSMKVPVDILERLKAEGIEGLALPSGEACEEYNRRCGRERTVLALHLTC